MLFNNENATEPSTTVFFDFDGTLADTKQIVLDEINKIASYYGFQKVNEISEMRWRIYYNLLRINFGLFGMRKHLSKEILDHMEHHVEDIKLQDGLAECIKELNTQGVQLGIITTNRKETVINFLKENSLDNYFNFNLIESAENKRKKLITLIANNKLLNECIFYVGDQESDVNATKGLAHTVAVTWGFEPEETLKRSKPDFIASKPEQVAKIVVEYSHSAIRTPMEKTSWFGRNK